MGPAHLTINPTEGGPMYEALKFKKSTFSDQTGGCVEVARDGDLTLVRDSKDPTGPVLSYNRGEWDAFLRGAKAGEFDRA